MVGVLLLRKEDASTGWEAIETTNNKTAAATALAIVFIVYGLTVFYKYSKKQSHIHKTKDPY
jgi:hypothetical protein